MWSCHAGWFGGLGGWWSFIPHLLGMLLVVGGIFLIIRHFSRPAVDTYSNSGLQILEERYARGEISREEYQEKKDTMLKK